MTPRHVACACAAAFAALFALLPARAPAAEVGEALQSVALRDANDGPSGIPDLGTKVLAIFYNDADEADLNDPLADAIKARKFDETRYRGIGIANLADSKMPNFLIRKVIRGKIEKYKSTILTDPDHLLANAWRLGDCNGTSVFLLIGKDGKVVHVRRGGVRGEEIQQIVELIAKLVAAG
jgi:hypothetical protein